MTSSRLVTSSQPVSDAKSVLPPSSPCDIIGDDNYSSEEELKEINVKRKYCQRVDQKYTEKRKWSEMSIDDEDRRSEQVGWISVIREIVDMSHTCLVFTYIRSGFHSTLANL